MEVRYSKSVVEPVLSILQQRMPLVLHAFPSWCTLVIVTYDEDDPNEDNSSAVIETEYKYRFCRLTLYPQFLTDIEWHGTLIHELHHAIMAPYTKQAERIVEGFVTDEATKTYLLLELADLEEQVVEDAKHCIKCLLDNTPHSVVS